MLRDSDFLDEVPVAVLLAVVIEQSSVHMGWIGGDVAVVSRGPRVIASTTPHTLVEKVKREQPTLTDLSGIPNVQVRNIDRATAAAPPDLLSASVQAGDGVLLLSRAAFRGPCVAIERAVSVAAAHEGPAVVAEKLASIAFDEGDAPYSAVVAVRIDSVDGADRGAAR